MAESKTVCVVTPTYNAATCLQLCIDSIKSQTMPVSEHIVVDGGSLDNTVEIAKGAGCTVISERDAGLYHAMSKGVMMAKSDYIHILNADDKYSGNDSVEAVITKMAAEDLELCHAYIHQVNDEGKPIRRVGREVDFNGLRRKMRVAHPSVFVRAEVYKNWGTYSESLRVAADHDWVLRIWPRVKVGFLDKVIVDMTLGGVSNSQELLSYKESFAVGVIHGLNPIYGYANFLFELTKHKILLMSGKLG